MGILTQKDAKLFRRFFKEMARLRGISVYYRYITKQDVSIHSEFSYEMSKPIKMDIIFDQNPLVSTLRRFGWVSENSDDKPYIAQLPFDAPEIQVGCTITITSHDLQSCRDFKITSMKALLEYPDCWTCTLAPVFFSDESRSVYKETNYNYVDTPDADIDNDAPDNTAENFYYLNTGKNKT